MTRIGQTGSAARIHWQFQCYPMSESRVQVFELPVPQLLHQAQGLRAAYAMRAVDDDWSMQIRDLLAHPILEQMQWDVHGLRDESVAKLVVGPNVENDRP